jgi:hypothetical protein
MHSGGKAIAQSLVRVMRIYKAQYFAAPAPRDSIKLEIIFPHPAYAPTFRKSFIGHFRAQDFLLFPKTTSF